MAYYPDVPDVPGVPTLSRNPFAAAAAPIALLTEDLVPFGSLSGTQWGIFLDGQPVVEADNVADFSYKKEWTIADYPIEGGQFQSYDKVEHPFDARVRFSSGGSEVTRQALLNSISSIAGDYNLYDVATPEIVYSSANIMHFDYRRTSENGAGLIIIDVWLQEIRIAATGTTTTTSATSGATIGSATSGATIGSATTSAVPFVGITSPQDAAATSPISGGPVQPTAPTTQQQTELDNSAIFVPGTT